MSVSLVLSLSAYVSEQWLHVCECVCVCVWWFGVCIVGCSVRVCDVVSEYVCRRVDGSETWIQASTKDMTHVVHSQVLQWIPQGTYDACHWLHSPLMKVPVQEGRSGSACMYSAAMSLASMASARCKETVQWFLESDTELWT